MNKVAVTGGYNRFTSPHAVNPLRFAWDKRGDWHA